MEERAGHQAASMEAAKGAVHQAASMEAVKGAGHQVALPEAAKRVAKRAGKAAALTAGLTEVTQVAEMAEDSEEAMVAKGASLMKLRRRHTHSKRRLCLLVGASGGLLGSGTMVLYFLEDSTSKPTDSALPKPQCKMSPCRYTRSQPQIAGWHGPPHHLRLSAQSEEALN